jgi:hypothetical protein
MRLIGYLVIFLQNLYGGKQFIEISKELMRLNLVFPKTRVGNFPVENEFFKNPLYFFCFKEAPNYILAFRLTLLPCVFLNSMLL